MPIIDPIVDLHLLRDERHATQLYLAVYKPATLRSGTVNGNHVFGSTTIALSGVSGAGTPYRHCTVHFGSTAGANDLGTFRLISFASPVLTIEPNNMDLAGGEFVTILNEIQPWAIKPSVTATTVTEDGLGYTDENTNYQPMAMMGPPACAFIDPTTGLATVKFYSTSVAWAGALTNWDWGFPSGTPGTSTLEGSSGAPISVTWDTPGQYYVSLKVTDSNGKTHTGYRPVFIFNRTTNQPYGQVEIQNTQGSVESGGWEFGLSVKGTASKTDFPDRALCVLFAEDWYGATQKSIGGDYVWRENIVAVGYIKGSTVKVNYIKGSVDFECLGIGPMLDTLPGYACTIKYDATPANWHELTIMNFDMLAYHVLTEHSTVSQIADIELNAGLYTEWQYDLVEGSLLNQVATQIYGAARAVFGSSRQGKLWSKPNPQLQPLASRTEDKIADLVNADYRDTVEVAVENLQKPIAILDFGGYNYSGTDRANVFSVAPASPWSTGILDRVDGIRVTDQAESNILAGLYEGWKNNPYPENRFPLRGNYRSFDVFPPEYFRVSLTAAQNNRGLVWTNVKMRPKTVSFTYKPGILLADVVAEMDSYGYPGVTGDYPVEPPDIPIPSDPPYPPTPPTPPEPVPTDWPDGTETGEYRTRAYVATMTRGIYYSGNFSGPGGVMPTWAQVNTGLPNTLVSLFTADPTAPSAHQYVLLTNGELYHRPGSGSWSKIADRTTMETLFGWSPDAGHEIVSIATNIWVTGMITAMVYTGDPYGAFHYAYSTDYGSTWQKHNVIPIGGMGAGDLNARCHGFGFGLFKGASAQATGQVAYFLLGTAGGSPGGLGLWCSIDQGATWTKKKAGPFGAAEFIQVDPFQDVVYRNYASGEPTGLYRSLNQGVTWTKISTDVPSLNVIGFFQKAYKFMPWYSPSAQTVYAKTLRYVGSESSTSRDIHKSIDGGSNWVTHTADALLTTNGVALGIESLGDAGDKLYGIHLWGDLTGNKSVVYASEDEGEHWEAKGGAHCDTGVDSIHADCGGVVALLPIYA